MVKRAKSPNLVEDAQYLVVWQPYPLNANWELPENCVHFAYWIAFVLGSYEHILGIHHKPSARSTVILEIDKRAKGKALNKLLGQHRWHEMLKRPTKEDKERVSQVYYCIYPTTREAQKDGWKRINVESEWFAEWSMDMGPFKNPYPATHWCPPLAEDPTNKSIARPLPVAAIRPPTLPPALVPGSSAWVSAQENPGQPTTQKLRGAWATRGTSRGNGNNRDVSSSAAPRGRGRISSSTSPVVQSWSSGNAWGPQARSPPSFPSVGSGGTTPTSARTLSGSPWANGPPGIRSPPAVAATSSVPPSTSTYPAAPPGLTRGPPRVPDASTPEDAPPTSLESLDRAFSDMPAPTSWADDYEQEQERRAQIAALAAGTYGDPEDDPDSDKPTYRPLEDDSSDDEFDGIAIERSYIPSRDRALLNSTLDWGTTEAVTVPSTSRGTPQPPSTCAGSTPDSEEDVPNLWADHVPSIFKDKNSHIPRCSAHGTLCKKGICEERKRLVRAEEKRKAEEEKKQQVAQNKAEKRQAKKEKKAKEKAEREGTTQEEAKATVVSDDSSDLSDDAVFSKPVPRRHTNGGGRGVYRGRRRGRGGASPTTASSSTAASSIAA